MKFKIFGIWVLLILAVSCQKDELPSSVNSSPEFRSSITFNGEVYTLSAGEMGLVQNSQSDTIGEGIIMTGKLSDPSCSNCAPGFKLIVKSPENYSYSPSSDLVSDLSQWNYSFNPISDSSFSLSMRASSGDAGNSGFWLLNSVPLNTSPIDSITFNLPEPGLHTLTFNSQSGICNIETSQTIDFDGQSIPCYGNITQNDSVPTWFTANPGTSFNLTTTSYTWTYGDSITTIEIDNFIDIGFLNGIDQLCVEMVDTQGCIATDCILFDTIMAGGPCSASIRLDNPELISVEQPSKSAKMVLEFTDNSGTTYSSEIGIQNNETITLISAESYIEPTIPDTHFIKVTYQINCLLFNSSGTGHPFSGTIVTAFETP